MTALAALILNLAIASLPVVLVWFGLPLILSDQAECCRFRAVLVLIAMVIVINMVYGYNQSGWWPIWQRFE
jgi:hypothetical protein